MIEGSKTSAYINQTSGNYPKGNLLHIKIFRYQFFEAHSFKMAFEKLHNELSVTQACFLMPTLITVVGESTKLQKHSSK